MAEYLLKMIVVAIMFFIYTVNATTKDDVNVLEDNNTDSRSTSFGEWSSVEYHYVYDSTKLVGQYNCCGWLLLDPIQSRLLSE